MDDAITTMTTPDGRKVELVDWLSNDAVFSSFADLVYDGAAPMLVDGCYMIRPGYTVRRDEDIPAPVAMETWAREHGVNAWKLRCAITEYNARVGRGQRSDRQFWHLAKYLWREIA